MSTTIEYQIVGDDGECHAGSTSIKDALHYLAVYRQDGPVHLEKVTREVIDLTIDAPPHSRQQQELSDFLDLTSEGEAAEDDNEKLERFDREIQSELVAPQPAQPDLEVVGYGDAIGKVWFT